MAVINYGDKELNECIPLERLGIGTTDYAVVKELWTGASLAVDAPGLKCTVPPRDARIYRFDK